MPPLSPEALAALMAGGAPHALLDVRERGAYERGHIFRATSLPRRLLEIRLPVLVSAHRTPLVLCDGDGRLAELCRPALEKGDGVAASLPIYRVPLVVAFDPPDVLFA